MSKHIIELNEDCKIVQQICVTEHGNAYTDGCYSCDLEEFNSDYINKHFGKLQDDAYKRGLEDAWEAARKIIRMPDGDILDLFPDCYASVCTAVQAILKYDASEAIAKLKAYEDKHSDRIEVGDEVVWSNGTTLIITRVYKLDDDEWCDCMDENGAMYGVLKNNVRKTGRHYDVQSILEAMKDVTER